MGYYPIVKFKQVLRQPVINIFVVNIFPAKLRTHCDRKLQGIFQEIDLKLFKDLKVQKNIEYK